MPVGTATSTVSRATVPDERQIAQVAQSVQRLAHVLNRSHAQMLDKARHDVEWSAHVVIHTLVSQGPMRSGALAEVVQADRSRISRQVAALVRDGFLVREADPVDRRACVLIPTAKARQAVAEHAQVRDQHFAAMLASWDEQDCARFAELLERFTVDLEAYKRGWADKPAGPASTV